MAVPDFIELPFTQDFAAPADHDSSDQYPSSLVRYFIAEFTKKKHRVFDPFIGFGTTALVAEDMERVPFGVEADGQRFEWSAGQLEHWQNIMHGDSAELADFGFPQMDFCITSPPWMPMHEKWNPLYGGDPEFAGYDVYLTRMGEVFAAVRGVMKKNATMVVHVSNLSHKKSFTPLVRDMGSVVSESFKPVGEVVVRWDSASDEHSHTHCLVFKAA